MSLGIGPLTSQFLGEIQDPPHKVIAKDGDLTQVFKAAMENSQSPEQATKDIAIAAVANAQRNPPATESAAKQMMLSMLDQLLAAANAVNEEDNKE